MNSKLINIIQITLTLLLIIFIFLKAGEFFEKVDWQVIFANWPYVLIAGMMFAFGYTFMAKHWAYVCKLVDPKASKSQRMAYLASQPYKYLPTSIFTFSSRATFAKKLGMSFKDSTEAQVIENINLIGSAMVLGMIFLLISVNILYCLLLIVIVALACFGFWKKQSLKIPKVGTTIDLRKWLVSLTIVSTGWIIMGLAFTVIVFGLEGRFVPILAMGANSLATGLGIVAVFAPGGIGVREVLFSVLSFASGTILIWRLTTFTVDILVGVFAGLAIARRRR